MGILKMMNRKLIFVLTLICAFGCCAWELDELTTIDQLEWQEESGFGVSKTQRVEQFKHNTRFQDRFKEIYCTDNEVMEAHLFGKGLLYDLWPDQADWNKLGGWYFNTFNPHGETIMIGFRSNFETGATEYTFYYHNVSNKEHYHAVGSVPGYYDPNNILSVAWDDNLNASTYTKTTLEILDRQRIKMMLEDKDGNSIVDTVRFPEVRNNFSRGNLYHGGNRPAQDKITAVKKIY